VEGVHFFHKPGLRPLWKRSSLIAWLEAKPVSETNRFALAQPGGRDIA
jgi:hypothetical protein